MAAFKAHMHGREAYGGAAGGSTRAERYITQPAGYRAFIPAPLTASDLGELERLLGESGAGGPDDVRRAADEARGLGLFVRSLIGMDRSAAKDALAAFTEGKTFTANQLEFVNLIVDHLTEHGMMEPERLYESPFTDLMPRGPDELFEQVDLDKLMRALEAVRASAVAA